MDVGVPVNKVLRKNGRIHLRGVYMVLFRHDIRGLLLCVGWYNDGIVCFCIPALMSIHGI